MNQQREPSLLEIASVDPMFGLHFVFSLLLLVPAFMGFPEFENVLSSLSGSFGLAASAFFLLFSLPSIVTSSQSFLRILRRPGGRLAFSKIVFGLTPAIIWLLLGLFNFNLVDQIAVYAGTSPFILYVVAALMPFYPVVMN